VRTIRGLSLGLTATLVAASLAGCAEREPETSGAIEGESTALASARLVSAREIAGGLLFARAPARAPRATEAAFVLDVSTRPGTLASRLPLRADGALTLEDSASGLTIDVRLLGATSAAGVLVDGLVVYPGAGPAAADVVIAADAERVEDFVAFAQRPAEEQLRYALEVPDGAALRLVGGVLEVLDSKGAPRLRAERPYALGAAGERANAALSVEGCAVDTSPRAPWGRALTAPGSSTCTVVVDFAQAEVGYPRVVDPAWTTTTNGLSSARSHLGGGAFTVDADPSDPAPAITLLFASGGYDALGDAVPTAELYEPVTRTFAVTGSMATARGEHTVTPLPGALGKLLVVGGRGKDTSTTPSASAELYDQQTGTFQALGAMATSRYGQTATLFQNGIAQWKVLVAGGITTLGQPSKTAELFDVATSTWSATGNMNSSRTSAAAAWLDPSVVGTAGLSGKVLVTGGISFGNALFSAELYDPSLGQFQLSVPGAGFGMVATRARSHHTATLLADGSVFLAGGRSADVAGTTWGDGELFGSNGFPGTVIDLLGARSDHTASHLPDGSLLFVGGIDGTGAPIASTTIWQGVGTPATSGASLTSARATHIAGEVDQGKSFASGKGVIVVGGRGAAGPLSTAELLTRPNGDGCALDIECQSGFCVTEPVDAADPSAGTVSLCCDTSCDDLCRSCTAAGKGAGSDGACGFAAVGTDVGWQCVNEVEFFLECANAGALTASELNDCKPGTCDNVGFRCNPNQSCATGQPVPCSDTGYCSPSGSPPESAIPADCTAAQPDVGTCLERGSIGSPCGHCYECESGLTCVDGVCCTTGCGSDVTDPGPAGRRAMPSVQHRGRGGHLHPHTRRIGAGGHTPRMRLRRHDLRRGVRRVGPLVCVRGGRHDRLPAPDVRLRRRGLRGDAPRVRRQGRLHPRRQLVRRPGLRRLGLQDRLRRPRRLHDGLPVQLRHGPMRRAHRPHVRRRSHARRSARRNDGLHPLRVRRRGLQEGLRLRRRLRRALRLRHRWQVRGARGVPRRERDGLRRSAARAKRRRARGARRGALAGSARRAPPPFALTNAPARRRVCAAEPPCIPTPRAPGNGARARPIGRASSDRWRAAAPTQWRAVSIRPRSRSRAA
jgi:hypothetical protein